jgi:hypothetical protein
MTDASGIQATPPGWYPTPLVAPEGTKPFTPYIWILALIPIVQFAITVNYLRDFWGYFQRILAISVSAGLDGSSSGTISGDLFRAELSIFSPAYFIVLIGGFVLYGLSALFAYRDWRTLQRRGVPRPFHFAFAFITSGVYIIGRSVVVRRRIGRGISPMWVWIALTAAETIALIILYAIAIAAFAGELSQYSFPTTG